MHRVFPGPSATTLLGSMHGFDDVEDSSCMLNGLASTPDELALNCRLERVSVPW